MLRTLKNLLLGVDKLSLSLFILVSLCYQEIIVIILPAFILVYIIQIFRVSKKALDYHTFLATSFYLMVYSLVFFRSIHNVIVILNVLLFGYYFLVHIKERINKKVNLKVELLIIAFFAFIFLNQVLFKPYFAWIDKYLLILLYVVLFFLIKKSNLNLSTRKSMIVFIASTTVAVLSLVVINFIQQSLTLSTNTFFAEALGLTHVYLGLYMGTSFSFMLTLLDDRKYQNRRIGIAVATFLILIIVYVGARMALLATFCILGVFLYRIIKMPWYQKMPITFSLLLMLGMVSYKNIPRIKNDINNIKELYCSVQQKDKEKIAMLSWSNMYKRYLVTSYSLQEIKENIFLGIGLQNIIPVLGEKILKDGNKYYEPINSHNQYLDFFLGMGVFPFLYFLVMIVQFFRETRPSFYFLIFMILIMLTESILARVKGISLFFLFVLIFSIKNQVKIND